jgi:salicylate hydroxylase
MWLGKGKHFLTFPLRAGALINYVGFVPADQAMKESWTAPGDPDELRREFAGWDPKIATLLQEVRMTFRWALYDRDPLPVWTKGKLTLLGDAAHAMLPHLGQGANQAIEDGIALAVFLQEHGSAEVAACLRRYEAFRRGRTEMIQAEARRNGWRYDSRYENLEQRDREIKNSATLRKSIYDYDVEKAALDYLRQS